MHMRITAKFKSMDIRLDHSSNFVMRMLEWPLRLKLFAVIIYAVNIKPAKQKVREEVMVSL